MNSGYDASQAISCFNMPPGGPFALTLREVEEWEKGFL